MIVGVFHPSLNACGGAEVVAIKIIDTLKQNGHKVMILTDKKIDYDKIKKTYNINLNIDSHIVFPFAFFQSTDYHNIYTDIIRIGLLRRKCNCVIDTYSNEILPGVDIAYIHFPFLKSIPQNFKNRWYYLPFRMVFNTKKLVHLQSSGRLIVLANSQYTAQAIREIKQINPQVLYPPLISSIYDKPKSSYPIPRDNIVVTVSRISPEKKLETVPNIAHLTSNGIKFLIVGLLYSKQTLNSIKRSIERFEIENRVKILLNVSRDHLQEILLKSKVYLHPTVGEHFGISIVEAMASGCIPIVHNSGGPREFIPKDFRYQSLEEAAKKIEKAMFECSPQKSRQMIQISNRFHEKHFSKKFMEIFKSSVLKTHFIE